MNILEINTEEYVDIFGEQLTEIKDTGSTTESNNIVSIFNCLIMLNNIKKQFVTDTEVVNSLDKLIITLINKLKYEIIGKNNR